MKIIDNFIKKANDLLTVKNDIVNHASKKIIDGVFDGYVNGFGPTVISSGLLPTIATYAADPKRAKVLNIICKIANIEGNQDGSAMLQYCLANFNNQDQQWLIKEKLITASIALKLVLRTFDITDQNKSNHE